MKTIFVFGATSLFRMPLPNRPSPASRCPKPLHLADFVSWHLPQPYHFRLLIVASRSYPQAWSGCYDARRLDHRQFAGNLFHRLIDEFLCSFQCLFWRGMPLISLLTGRKRKPATTGIPKLDLNSSINLNAYPLRCAHVGPRHGE